ncbi:hypothetical protein [Paenibacillus sp. 32352]|uniref:hypothetical protein n=1 Tax=Paenibacillus sp. 32352 TaxID=1969111 RepID=UPI0009ABEDF1|nr:hypothetical protein [Paenibacillus sp. 32352]
MQMLSSYLSLDVAIVKSEGVYFREKIYTCNAAIKQKWFQRALEEGNWEVFIYFDPQVSDSILVLLEDGRVAVANQIVIQLDNVLPEDVEQYHNKINYLKVIRARNKRRNKYRKIFAEVYGNDIS